MKRLGLIITVVLGWMLSVSAVNLKPEVLNYKVLYKWGLVQKHAGNCTITLTRHGNSYEAVATARSVSWADKFYHLRDTLRSTMSVTDLAPTRYERLAHEDGKYSRDLLQIKRSGNTFSTTAHRWRRRKGSTEVTEATINLTAEGMTVDLLSSFFYLRSLQFSTMNPGNTTRLNIFSGKKKELLSITYKGLTNLKLNGKEYQAYKVVFTFTTDGRTKSSDPIEAWISTEGQNIPLKLVGKLKIGQVQCIYNGNL